MKTCSVLSKKDQLGLGLIELMISMLIGLFIMAGVVQMFSTTTQNAVANAGLSRIQENSRYVYTRIAEDIAQTGNLGCVSVSNGTINQQTFMENLLGLASGADEAYDFDSIVNGEQSATSATDPAGLVAVGTDVFRIRYVNHLFKIPLSVSVQEQASSVTLDTTDPDYGRLSQYQVVALTNCVQGAVFMVTNAPAGDGVVRFDTGIIAPTSGINPGQFNVKDDLFSAARYSVVDGTTVSSTFSSRSYLYAGTTGSYLYYIGTAAAAGTGNVCVPGTSPQHCALFRRQKGINEELVQGVSNMEVFYGWTDAAGLLFFSKANGVSDWSRVDRLRVVMEFNSIEGVSAQGNTIDTSENGLITRQVERTFNLANQL